MDDARHCVDARVNEESIAAAHRNLIIVLLVEAHIPLHVPRKLCVEKYMSVLLLRQSVCVGRHSGAKKLLCLPTCPRLLDGDWAFVRADDRGESGLPVSTH